MTAVDAVMAGSFLLLTVALLVLTFRRRDGATTDDSRTLARHTGHILTLQRRVDALFEQTEDFRDQHAHHRRRIDELVRIVEPDVDGDIDELYRDDDEAEFPDEEYDRLKEAKDRGRDHQG